MDFHSKPATYVGYIHLQVADLKTSLYFCQGLHGLKTLNQQDYWSIDLKLWDYG